MFHATVPVRVCVWDCGSARRVFVDPPNMENGLQRRRGASSRGATHLHLGGFHHLLVRWELDLYHCSLRPDVKIDLFTVTTQEENHS